jgi:hypothetical protein
VTTTGNGDVRRLRCALFVDFDNVYLGLLRLDPDAAAAFATEPGRWLAAMETGTDIDGDFTRRFLVRACYLNPSAFSQFRPNFTRAGFTVVDCPSLTQQGKSSADINLVLDAVDALAAPTHYDEFVIVSADADFTPLALRCRAADRRVTIVTASPAASAYRAVADTVVTAEQLSELVRPPAPATDVAPDAAPAASAAAGDRPKATPARRAVLRMVRDADRPVNGGSVAQVAQKADPSLGPDWGGAGSFFPWLARAVPEVAASQGFVWDPDRFSEADLPTASGVDLPPLQRQVVAVTDIPNLPTERYRVLLEALAADVAEHPFDRPETARRVRDACQAAGEPIGRGSVNAVIAGVLYAGLELDKAATARKVAATWADHVVGLCRGARMELSSADVAAIRSWVSGCLVKG